MLNAQQFEPQQLKMFMSAREIMGTHQPIDAEGYENDIGRMWHEKAVEARNEGLMDDIRRHGVVDPVHTGVEPAYNFDNSGRPELIGGHHRVAVMSIVDPDSPTIPVVHHESWWSPPSRQYPYT